MRRWLELVPAALAVKASYDPIGSGNGRNKVLAGDVDFGGIVCAVNLPGMTDNQFRLTGALLAGVYAGTGKKWNDPQIVAANPGVALPDMDIHPVSQGTPNGPMPGITSNFTQYLLATNQDWRDKFGPASPPWSRRTPSWWKP